MDVEAEGPMLWPPDAESQLTGRTDAEAPIPWSPDVKN